MTLKLIANVINHKGKLLIGYNNDLVVKSSTDLKYFKRITTGHTIVMGRKTWDSMGKKPLPNRKTIVLTRNPSLKYNDVQCMTLENFYVYATHNEQDIFFVIGGGEVYDTILQNIFIRPVELFITQMNVPSILIPKENLSYISFIPQCYALKSISERYTEVYKDEEISFRFLVYSLSRNSLYNSYENQILNLYSNVLSYGENRVDRTGTGTLSKFGHQMKFNISHSIPLLTTKNVPWKMCIKELLWFLQGHTDTTILEKQGIKIWKENTSREFLDKRNLDYKEGVLGAGYGWQWRFSGAEYDEKYADTRNGKPRDGFDQIQNVIDTLKTDPSSRRILVNAWNPKDLEKMALPPCFVKDTLILTKRGYLKIQDVHYNDFLYTHKGEWKPIVDIQVKEYTDDMYRIGTKGNPNDILCTKDHPFYVTENTGGSLEPYWCHARDLKNKHNLILVINQKKKIPCELESSAQLEQMLTLGFLFGELYGCLKMNENCLVYMKRTNVDESMYDYLKLLYTPKESASTKSWFNDKQITTYTIDTLSNKNLSFIKEQRIPEWIQDAPKNYIKEFLKGYSIATTRTENKSKGQPEKLRCKTIETAYAIQRLYAKIGVYSSIQSDETDFNLTTDIYNKNIDEKYLYYPIEGIVIECGSYIPTRVYNFEVEDDHSYTVQNVAVHNCHYTFQFYASGQDMKDLSCHIMLRSNDCFLGAPFNAFEYSVLTYIIAKKCDMKPKNLVYTISDAHIYTNHIEQVKEQLNRVLRCEPVLLLSDSIKNKEFDEMTIDDFEVVGYFPDTSIKGAMAV